MFFVTIAMMIERNKGELLKNLKFAGPTAQGVLANVTWGSLYSSRRAFRRAVYSIDVCVIACLVASRLVGWLVCGLDGVHMSIRTQYFFRPLLIRYLGLVFFSRKSYPTHMPRLM